MQVKVKSNHINEIKMKRGIGLMFAQKILIQVMPNQLLGCKKKSELQWMNLGIF